MSYTQNNFILTIKWSTVEGILIGQYSYWLTQLELEGGKTFNYISATYEDEIIQFSLSLLRVLWFPIFPRAGLVIIVRVLYIYMSASAKLPPGFVLVVGVPSSHGENLSWPDLALGQQLLWHGMQSKFERVLLDPRASDQPTSPVRDTITSWQKLIPQF